MYAEKWAEVRKEQDTIRDAGRVLIAPGGGARLHVVAPKHDSFIQGAIELNGRWRARSKVWSFSGRSKRLVIELANRVFGPENVKVQS